LSWSPPVEESTRRARSKAAASGSGSDDQNVLAVGCWGVTARDQVRAGDRLFFSCNRMTEDLTILMTFFMNILKILCFYNEAGYEAGPERRLGYDPCAMAWMRQGEAAYIVLGGSNKELSLHTHTGSKLTSICKANEIGGGGGSGGEEGPAVPWLWSASTAPGHNFVAVGGSDGLISVHELLFENVHDIFADRYAYRLSMTDVVVQHLESERKVRIKHKNHVGKVALYSDLSRDISRLAVQVRPLLLFSRLIVVIVVYIFRSIV